MIVFPISLLFNLKSNLAGLGEIDKTLNDLGMRMRLTGRDLMRMGAAMEQFFTSILGQIGNVLKGSMMWEAGLEDISWALEDVGYVLGDILAPILDTLSGLIESFAEALEVSPLLQWIVIIGIAGVVIGLVMGILMKFTGMINLFFGTLITSSKGGLNLLQVIKALGIGFTEGDLAAANYIKSVGKVGKTATKAGKSAATGFKDWLTSMSGAKGLLKSVLKGTLMLGGAALLAAVAFAVLQDLQEPLMDLFTSIGDALSPVTDYLGGIIEFVADAIDNCPLLAAAFIAAAIAIGVGLLILQKGLSKVAEVAVDKLSGGLDKATEPMKNVGEGAWKNTLANAALVASIALLVFALTNFFAVMGGMGISIWEAVGALGAVLLVIIAFIIGLAFCAKMLADIGPDIWMGIAAVAALVGIVILLTWGLTMLLVPLTQLPGGIANLYLLSGALIMLMASLVAIAIILGTFGAVAFVGAVIMLILAAAALMLGTAMLLAGLGIQMAAQGIMLLVGNLGGVMALVPAIFGLAAGILALGFAGFLAFPALVLLATGVMILAAALMALIIPLGIIRALGGEGAVLAAVQHMPFLAEGGIITKGGMAVVHPGEEVRPAEAVKRKKEGVAEPPLVININAPIGSREIAQSFADEIEKIMDRRSKRSR